MDLSKAFDCLPHGLIIDKLAAYGLSDSACSLLQSYLSDRKQMVKLGHCKSTFLKIIKGVPQGSILGPLLFNIFLNDIFYFVKKSNLYNYADDNTLCYSHHDLLETKNVLTSESESVIECRAVEIPCPTCPTWSHFIQDKLTISIYLSLDKYKICIKLIKFCI